MTQQPTSLANGFVHIPCIPPITSCAPADTRHARYLQRRTHTNVPDTPAGVLEDVRNKLRGFMNKQPIPLSVDGQVDELIMQATDKKNLAAMYVGWCAFF